jgi:hypothetical protein
MRSRPLFSPCLTGAVGLMARKQLRELVGALTTTGVEVGARIIPGPEMARFLRDCGVQYLCFNEAQATTAGFTHSALYALFSVIAHEVRGLGFTNCLWNASTGEDIKRAAALGFLLFSGSMIGPNHPAMTLPHPLKTTKVFL